MTLKRNLRSNRFVLVMTSDLYQGMWDCLADEENELSFRRGQIIHIISKVSFARFLHSVIYYIGLCEEVTDTFIRSYGLEQSVNSSSP